jgi:hypothetical protein
MAKTWFKPGSWNVICERTGFKVKAGDIREEWTGARVDKRFWESRHPQEFLKLKPDIQSVPWSFRPADQFTDIPNLLVDPDGITADGIYWDYNTWSPGWSIALPTSSDLVTARSKDIRIGVDGFIPVGSTLTLRVTPTVVGYASGTLTGQLRFYDEQRVLSSTSTLFAIESTTSTAVSGSVTVPDVSYVQVVFNPTAFTATSLSLTGISLEV